MTPVVLSAIFYESSTYDDQYASSFETHFDRDVGDRLMNMTDGGTNLNANTLSRAVGDAIRVQAKAETRIIIPNGFEERRLNFIITVLINDSAGYEQRQVLSGYTDYFGVNMFKGTIDEDMVLYINNSITLRDTPHHSLRGNQNRVHVESNEFIMRNSTGARRGRGDTYDRMVRPVDIFNNHGSSEIQRMMGGADSYTDTRSELGTEIKMGIRGDNNMADWFSRTLKAGLLIELDTTHEFNPESRVGEQPESKSSLAAGAVNVGRMDDNALFMNFMDACNFQQEGTITIREMRDCTEWPETIRGQDVTQIITRSGLEDRNYTSYERGQGNALNGADTESIAARIIARSLPAILMSHQICDAQVEFTNDTPDSTMRVIVYNEKPLVPGMSVGHQVGIVEEKIRVQVAGPVSRNNQLLVNVSVDCSAVTDVKIWVSIEDGPREFYCFPMSCDGLTSPQKTDDWSLADKITNDTSTIINDMADNLYSRQNEHVRRNGPKDIWDDGGRRESTNRFD